MAATALRRAGSARRGIVALLVSGLVAAVGLSAATGWMRVDGVDEIRWLLRKATMALAGLHLPWGSGIGSFVPVFEQAVPDVLLMPNYVNAAHNDFAQ